MRLRRARLTMEPVEGSAGRCRACLPTPGRSLGATLYPAEGKEGMMAPREVSRRTVLQGGAALAALGVFRSRMTADAFASRRGAGLAHWSAQSAPAAATFPTRPGE